MIIQDLLEAPYLRDVFEQPAALQRTWDHLTEDASLRRMAQQARRIVLTGMGGSLYALYPLHLRLIQSGLPSYWVETAELLHYQREVLQPDALVIVLSQSGQSAEIVALLDAVRGPLIALSNNLSSPLAAAANVLLTIHAGPEATVSCKTYVSSLLLLEWLGAQLTGADRPQVRDQLATAPGAVSAYLANWQDHVLYLQQELTGVRRIFVTGRGPSVATAETGGLILKESVRFHAEGMSCAAFRHGPWEVLNGGVLVVVMAGDSRSSALNRKLVDDVLAVGGRAQLVAADANAAPFRIPPIHDSVRPVLEILPVQMMTLALGLLIGREPGKFELATKVTSVE